MTTKCPFHLGLCWGKVCALWRDDTTPPGCGLIVRPNHPAGVIEAQAIKAAKSAAGKKGAEARWAKERAKKGPSRPKVRTSPRD